jgi:membrane associated rhomboid family serine protease/Flp pilus assembly protein TadD
MWQTADGSLSVANCAQCGRKLPGFVLGRKICQWCVRHEAAQRGEDVDQLQPLMPTPWAGSGTRSMILTQIFFAMNAAVFLAMALAEGSIADFSSGLLVQWGGNAGSLTLGGQWWRLLTCLFVHGGIIHIAFNMWCLWDLGALCESLYGRWTFAALYLTCGLGASAASVAWQPNGLSVGASGAIFGLAGALIASYYLGEFSMPAAAVRRTLTSVVVFVGYSLIFSAMSSRTDNAAHVGGLVTGLVLGALIAKGAPDPGQSVRRVAIFLLVLLGVSAGLMGLQHSHSYLIHAQRAGRFLAENKSEEAIAELRRVIQERPDFVPAHFALAQSYLRKSDFGNAEIELRRVLELRPGSEDAAYALGILYLEQNKNDQARSTFARMISADPNSAEARYGLGLVDLGEEKYQDALANFSLAAKFNPDFEDVDYKIGRAQFKLKNYDDAIAAFHREQEKIGDYEAVEAALADAYRAKGMTQQAEEAARKARQLSTKK